MDFGEQESAGIKKKVIGQKRGLVNLGYKTDLFYIESDCIVLETSESQEYRVKKANKLKFLKFLYWDFIDYFKLEKYDIFLVRHFPMHPLSYWMIYRIRSKFPNIKIIFEFPTFPYSIQLKALGLKHYVFGLIDDIFTPLSMKKVDVVLTVSQDIEILGKPTIITSNGIDITQFKPINALKFDDTLNIVGLANVQIWHGYDRIIKGLHEYYHTQNPSKKVMFHIVGAGKECEKLVELAKELKVSEYIFFHGAKFGDKLYDILNQCHMGTGALADFRVGMSNSTVSPLKNREYCAFGLPFICTYKDSDLPDEFPFILLMKADETAIDIAKVVKYFTNLYAAIPNYSVDLHEFTRSNLSWESKLYGLKEWIDKNDKK